MISFHDTSISTFKNIFIIYLIISSNFLANLFGCRTQDVLTNNMLLKHLLGFMTMYFFVVLVDNKSKLSDSPKNQLLFTILFYITFLLTTRMDFKWWVGLIVILCMFYILQVYKDHDKTEDKDKKKYEYYQIYLSYLMITVLIIGFLVYIGRKKVEYKDSFNLMTFIFGKTTCSNNNIANEMSDYNAILHTFK
jgi:uncharacterized membrane protein